MTSHNKHEEDIPANTTGFSWEVSHFLTELSLALQMEEIGPVK